MKKTIWAAALLASWGAASFSSVGLRAAEEDVLEAPAASPEAPVAPSAAAPDAALEPVEMTDLPVTAPLGAQETPAATAPAPGKPSSAPKAPLQAAPSAQFMPRLPQQPAAAALVVKAIQPSTLNTEGSNGLVLRGDHFHAGMKVWVGSSECRDLVVLAPKKAICIAPRSPEGSYDLSVTTPEGRRFTLPRALRFAPQFSLTGPQAKTVGKRVNLTLQGGKGPFHYWLIGKGELDPDRAAVFPGEHLGTRLIGIADATGESETPIVIYAAPKLQPEKKSVAAKVPFHFSVTGGAPPFRFSLASGVGTVDEASGLYVSTEAGEAIVHVTDAAGAKSEAKVTVTSELKFSAAQRATVTDQKLQLQASGGVPPYVYSVVAGEGSVDASTGLYQAGSATGLATVRVTDAEGSQADSRVSINQPLSLLPAVKVLSLNESKHFVATGGMPPYHFSLVSGKGLIHAETGFYSAPDESGEAVIRVTDRENYEAQARINIVRSRMLPKLLAAGREHTCAVDGTAVECWGNNDSGQLGNGTFKSSPLPVSATLPGASDKTPVTALVAGAVHTCALSDGRVSCWGDNGYGQLGFLSAGSKKSARSAMPMVVPGMEEGVSDLAAGHFHTCAIKHGAVYCWGLNDHGQLGLSLRPGAVMTPAPVIPKGASAISAGLNHTCVALEKSIRCWGQDPGGQDRGPAVILVAGERILGLQSGAFTSCAILASGTRCWGFNGAGSLGKRTGMNYGAPKLVDELNGDVTALVSGMYHSCALINRSLRCWGLNMKGQVGVNSDAQIVERMETVQNVSDPIKAIAAGFDHTCVLGADGVRCWGDNSHWQSGGTMNQQIRAPKRVLKLKSGKAATP